MKQEEARLQKILADATQKDLQKLLPIFEAEKTLTAQEAYKLGLLTEEP